MYDAMVLGGGPAGAAAALTLARAGRDVLLVDGGGGAGRVGEALPPAARPLLRELGVLERVRRAGHLRCPGNVALWGAPVPVVHDFLLDPHGCGWHLDRARFDRDLQAAAEQAGARLARATRAVAVDKAGRGWRVRLRHAGEERLARSRWLIDASGRGSVFARRLGAVRRCDDRLLAFVACWRPAAPDRDARTWIEAAPDGWWYSARSPSGARLTAYHTDADLAARDALRSARGLLAHLAQSPHLHALLASCRGEIDGRPRGVDASSGRLDRATGDGWLAVGDAAASFDPLSSQGLLNALYTGLKGAEALHRALAGEGSGLLAYEDRLRRVYRTYLARRTSFYAAEGRWPGRTFWRRRAP